MVRKVDTSSLNNPDNFTDWGEYFLTQARQRKAQDQALDMQRQTAQMAQQKFDLERQQFEAEKADAAAAKEAGMMGGNSFQAQLFNLMRQQGLSVQEAINESQKYIPGQDGSFYRPVPFPNAGVARVASPGSGSPQSDLLGQTDAMQDMQANGVPRVVAQNDVPTPNQMQAGVRTMRGGGLEQVVQPRLRLNDQQELTSNLAKSEGQAANALSTINALIDEAGNLRPEAQSSVGGPMGIQGRMASVMPITAAQRRTQPYIDQLKGQAFLQAFESLKGGGQITEVEGQKATNAILRLQQYQNETDFANALKDLREVVQAGLARARQNASRYGVAGQAQAAQDNPAGNVVNWEDLP